MTVAEGYSCTLVAYHQRLRIDNVFLSNWYDLENANREQKLHIFLGSTTLLYTKGVVTVSCPTLLDTANYSMRKGEDEMADKRTYEDTLKRLESFLSKQKEEEAQKKAPKK